MREITIKVYQYSELSDEAKEHARNWYLEGMDNQHSWDCMKDDAEEIGLILSGTNNRGNMEGEFKTSAEDCAKKIIEEHGETCDTYKKASAFIENRKKLTLEHADNDCENGLTHAGENALAELDDEFLCDICECYRVMLEKEYEYQSSEEAIAEAIQANEYEFNENGKRI